MMKKYKPYLARCEKCGAAEGKDMRGGGGAIYFRDHEIEYVHRHEMQSVLLRTCWRCGYLWHELPIDAAGNA